MKILLFKLFLCIGFQLHAQENAKFTSIFNGKDFSGWNVPNDNIWFSVDKGELHIKSGPRKKGQVLNTKKSYKDFHLKLEFKFGEGTIDSGIFIRNNREQIQIGISGSLKRDMTASPYIPGKGYPVEAKGIKDLLKMEDWNALEIKAVGKTYTTFLNGKQVMTYTSDSAIEQGPLGIQLHGNRNMSIAYRNLKILEL